jgi:NADPH2:quinone reductase
VVLDGIGGAVALRSYRALARGGRLVLFGQHSTLVHGRRSATRLAVFYAAGALALAASTLPGGRRVCTYRSAITRDRRPDWYREDVATLFRLHAQGALHPHSCGREPGDRDAGPRSG